ncbi:mandelate racemase/muconate lactonizing enzyme family protein [Salinirarus marinus]|uniref:mandelate racemase/muconate lactonizing enzyme family protein n=1 Tax=Salinirarus marinus TaxID=3068310 RepID=UPI003C6CA080
MGIKRTLSAERLGLEVDREPGIRDLEITDVQTTVVGDTGEYGSFLWTFVRVYTDAGIVGTGESFPAGGVPGNVERIKPLLVGENPLDIDRLYEQMVERMTLEGSIGGTIVSAISGIEIALHDIAGKVLEVPAYQLLGGKYRDEVRAYCDCEHERGWEPEQFADEAERTISEYGFDGIKFNLDLHSGVEKDHANRRLSSADVEHRRAIVEAVTERVSPDAEAAFDCHWGFTAESAKRVARAIEPYDVWWLEDPIPPENVGVQKDVTEATSTPIATGENLARRHGVADLITSGAADILHIDVPKVGGMRETRKIADMADTYYTPMAMHNLSSPVGTMASAHVAAAVPSFVALEFHSYDVPEWHDLVEESALDDGHVPVHESPGLGLTLNLDVVEENMVDGETLFDEA